MALNLARLGSAMTQDDNPTASPATPTRDGSDSSLEGGPGEKESPEVASVEEYLEENEPYLGPAWAVVMLILYLLKEAFPAEQFTTLWYFQIYIVGLVISITVFTLVKRHQFYRSERKKRAGRK